MQKSQTTNEVPFKWEVTIDKEKIYLSDKGFNINKSVKKLERIYGEFE